MERSVTIGTTDGQAAPHSPVVGTTALEDLSTRALVGELAHKASLLARTEVELAKAELRKDLRAELQTAGGLGLAGLCALVSVVMVLVAAAFGLQEGGVMAGWLAALIIAALVLAAGTAAGLLGWARRTRSPMAVTRRTLVDDLRWAKERIA
jgi:hypothetical protein